MPKKGCILVIDDEPAMLEACGETLSYHGYEVHLRNAPEEGIKALTEEAFDLVLIDLKMPGKDGLQTLRELKSIDQNIMAVMITAFPTISTAVEAVKEGAFDYLAKPFTPDQLLIVVQRALGQKRLAEENMLLRRTLKFRPGFEGIVARSQAMQRAMDLVEKIADSEASVVLEGETGSGKELMAQSLHRNSPRRDGAFLPIDCGTLPDQLLESELFGHERGSFTGAYTRKLGLLESAQGGTIFLDEISSLSLDLQAKLLRVLQERNLRRVGGREIIVEKKRGAPFSIDTRLSFAQAKESFEQQYLAKLLKECGGNVSRAAAQAGVHRSSFQRLMKKRAVQSQEFRQG